MTRLLILLLFLTFALGCKSIKKAKSLAASSELVSQTMAMQDTVSVQHSEKSEAVEETEIIEEIKTSQVPVDSAGVTVFKPETVTKTVTKTTRKSSAQLDTIKAESSSSDQSISQDTSTDTKDLDKSSEGQDPIESITTAIFPTWGKILGAILTAVVPVVWGIWKKRKEAE